MLNDIRDEIDYRVEASPRLHAATNITKQFATSISQSLDVNKTDLVLNAVASINPLLAAVSHGLNENSAEISDNFKTLITGNRKQEEILSQQTELLNDQTGSLDNIESYTKAAEESLDELEKSVSLQQKTLDHSVKNLNTINKQVLKQDESIRMLSKKPVSLDNKTINMLKQQHKEQYYKLDEISKQVKTTNKYQKGMTSKFAASLLLSGAIIKILYSLGMLKELKESVVSLFKKYKENPNEQHEESKSIVEDIVKGVAHTTNKVEKSNAYTSATESLNKIKESEVYNKSINTVNEIKGNVINKKDELIEKHSDKIEKIKESELFKDLSFLTKEAKKLNKSLDEKLAEIRTKDDLIKIKDDIQNKVINLYQTQKVDQLNVIKRVNEYNEYIKNKYDNLSKEVQEFKSKEDFFGDNEYKYKLINNVSVISKSKSEEIKQILEKVKNDEIEFEDAKSKIVSELDDLKKTETIYVEKVKTSIKEINGTIINNISDIKEELKNAESKEDIKNIINRKVNETSSTISESSAYKTLESVRAKTNSFLTNDEGKNVLDKSYIKTASETILPFLNSSLAGNFSLFKNFLKGDYKSIGKSLIYFTPLGPAVVAYDTGKVVKEFVSKKIKSGKSKQSTLEVEEKDLQQQSISDVEEQSKANKNIIEKTKESIDDKVENIKNDSQNIMQNGVSIIEDQVDVIKDSFEKTKSLKGMIELSLFSLKQQYNKKYQKEYAKDVQYDKFLAKTVADMAVTLSPTLMMSEGLSQRSISKIAWGFIGKHMPLLYHTINIPFLLGRTVARTIINSPSIIKKLAFTVMNDVGQTIKLISMGTRTVISFALKTPSMVMKLSKFIYKPIESIFKGVGGLISQTKESGLTGAKSWLNNTFFNITDKISNLFRVSDYGKAFKDLIFNPIKGEAKEWKNLISGTAKGVAGTTSKITSGVTTVAKSGAKTVGSLLLPGLFETSIEEEKMKIDKDNNKQLKIIAENIKEDTKLNEKQKDNTESLNNRILNMEKMREKRDKAVRSLLEFQNKLTGKMSKGLSSLKKKFFEYVTWQKIKGIFSTIGGFVGGITGAIKNAIVAGITIALPKLISKIKAFLGFGSKAEKTVEAAAKTAKAAEAIKHTSTVTNITSKASDVVKGFDITGKVAQGTNLAGKAANVIKDTSFIGNVLGNAGKILGTVGSGALKVAGKVALPLTALLGAYGATKEWSKTDYSSKEALQKYIAQQDKEFSKHGLLWHIGDAIWDPKHLGKYITYGGNKLYAAAWNLKDKLFGNNSSENKIEKVSSENGQINEKAVNKVETKHENVFDTIKTGMENVAKYTPYGLVYNYLKDKIFNNDNKHNEKSENVDKSKEILPTNKIKSEELKMLETDTSIADKFDEIIETIDKYIDEIKESTVQTANTFKQTSASVINNINNSSVVNNNGGNNDSSDGEKMAEMLNIRFKRMREYELKI